MIEDWNTQQGNLRIIIEYHEFGSAGRRGHIDLPLFVFKLQVLDLDNDVWMNNLLNELAQAAYNWRVDK